MGPSGEEFRFTIMQIASDGNHQSIEKFEIDQRDLSYRGEGNANIVLAIAHRDQVLRLPKLKSKSSSHEVASNDFHLQRISYVYNYIRWVSPLFGPNVASQPRLVKIDIDNKESFNAWLYIQRPNNRKKSSHSVFEFNYGLLYQDACILKSNLRCTKFDVFAVEIKPKQGWNITSLEETVLRLFGIDGTVNDKCRFCAMQYAKIKIGKTQFISQYCPLDLFSGDPIRMKKAMRCLIDSPQNNFKLFRNGQLIYSEHCEPHDLDDILYSIFGGDVKSALNDFIELLLNALLIEKSELKTKPKKTILKYLLNLQLLAQETMPHIAQKYLKNSHLFNVDHDTDMEWIRLHFAQLYGKLRGFDWNVGCDVNFEYLEKTLNLSSEEIYEIGATALDSSIMLTVQKVDGQTVEPEGSNVITKNGQQFLVETSIFDLDPKIYTKHFFKFIKRTRASYDAYKMFQNKSI